MYWSTLTLLGFVGLAKQGLHSCSKGNFEQYCDFLRLLCLEITETCQVL